MKYMLALSLILAALPASAKGVPAKDAGKEPSLQEMADKMAEGMSNGINFTAEQKKKVAAIFAQSMPERLELEKKVHKLEWTTDEKIRAILTDEQKELFDRWRMMRGHHPGMGRMGPPAGGPDQAGPGQGGPGQGGPWQGGPGQGGDQGPREGMEGGPQGGQPPPPGDQPKQGDGPRD